MEQKLVQKVLHVEGMTCTSCKVRIQNVLKKIEGIIYVKAIYSSSNIYITYDSNTIGLDKIIEALQKLDYTVIGRDSDMKTDSAVQHPCFSLASELSR